MASPCLCTRLRLATRKVSAIYDDALAPLGINVAQYALLRAIERAQPVSLTELGRLAALDRSTIGRNVRVVARMGLVETARGADHREAAVSLSGAGARLLAQAAPAWARAQAHVAERLGPALTHALDEILEAL